MSKISPAFEQYLAKCGPNDVREALVIYDSPLPDTLPDALPDAPDAQRARIAETATANRAVQRELRADYHNQAADLLPHPSTARTGKTTKSIGNSVLPVYQAQITQNTLPLLAENPSVVAVLPNQRTHLIRPKQIKYEDLAKSEGESGFTWGLTQLRVPELWAAANTKGQGVKVAVLDTGVHAAHPALAGRVADFMLVDSQGRRIKAQPFFDTDNHGTHVCGTIAGNDAPGIAIGVAPEATLYVGCVIPAGSGTLQMLLEGIAWAVEQGAQIISMSLGFTYYEPMFARVFDMLLNRNILPVIAIGNENHGNTSSPGSASNAFSVGAVEKMTADKVNVAFFSSGASLIFPGPTPTRIDKPDVVAPGAQIFSCIPPEQTPDGVYEYNYLDGTSMATPHVAGVAAILRAAKPNASATAIAQALKDTALHPDGPTARPDNRWGYGLIQPLAALQALA